VSSYFTPPRPISNNVDEERESEIFEFIDTQVAYDPKIQSTKNGRCPFIKSAVKRNLVFYSTATNLGLENPSLAVLEATDWLVGTMVGASNSCLILAFPYFDSESEIENLWVEQNRLLFSVEGKGVTSALSYRREGAEVIHSSKFSKQPKTPFWVLRFLKL
jgi:hypothetical protein